jgi:transposase
LILGYDEDLQKNIKLDDSKNIKVLSLPISDIKIKLEYLCKLYGINFIIQEEYGTSLASALDKDEIIEYSTKVDEKNMDFMDKYSGKRITPRLYRTKCGFLLNADVNAAINIFRKYKRKAKDDKKLSIRCLEGEVDAPVRIKVL